MFKIESSINYKKCGQDYYIVYSIAGSDTQIKQFVKEILDSMIEAYAEDYYYMKDLK